MCMFQKMLFEWAGEKPFEALDWNVQNIYAVSKQLAFPDGGWIYPNGQDWQLHRNADWFDLHCPIAIQYHDRQAATLMRIVLETAEKDGGEKSQRAGHPSGRNRLRLVAAFHSRRVRALIPSAACQRRRASARE